MAACTKCGADLAPYVPRCNYCNTVTAFGAAQQAEQERYKAAADLQAAQARAVGEQQARYAANAEVVRGAESAFNWALGSLFLCCIPVLPIVAIVMGLRTRSLAISRGIIVPSKLWMAFAMSATSLVAFGGLVTLSLRLEAEKQNRKGALEKAIGKHAGDEAPSIDTVCRMTELYLLDGELSGKHLVDGSVSCDAAKWTVTGDRAELTGVRVRFYEHDPELRANVCFEHGAKWVVDAVVTTTCAEHWQGAPAASAAASNASASAAPTASSSATPKDTKPKTGR